MGEVVSVFPINQFLDEGGASYFREQGLPVPYRAETSRQPTLMELKTALDVLSDFVVEYAGDPPGRHIYVTSALDPQRGPRTTIIARNIVELEAGEWVIEAFSFEKGWPELDLHILERLSTLCGPFIYLPHSGSTPIVVTPEMALPELRAGAPPPFTISDLMDLPRRPDDTRYEIINGVLHIAGQPHWHHQLCAGRILSALMNWSDQSGMGVALLAPGIIFTPEDVVAPDVIWASHERFKRVVDKHEPHYPDGYLFAAPDLVVEVLSPPDFNVERDQKPKLDLYSREGVLEYWIVDWRTNTAQIYRRREGALELITTLADSDPLSSPLLPGFSVLVRDLGTVPQLP